MSPSSDDGRNGHADSPDDAEGVLGRLAGERPRRLGRERPSAAARAARQAPPRAPRRAPAAAPETTARAPRQPRLEAPPARSEPSSTELLSAAVHTAGELARISLQLYGRLLRQALGVTRGSRRSDS